MDGLCPSRGGGKAPSRSTKGKVLASSRFKILGEGEKFTGKVNFTEDEANGKKTDDE